MNTKRLLSILLATVLLLACIPLSAVSAATLVWPVPGHRILSQGYHNNNAIDISDGSIKDATVVAAMGGTVTGIYLCTTQHAGSYGDCNGFGTGLVIRGDDGRTYSYAHMAPGSIPANVYYGARVSAGQTIGRVGTTGSSTGYHLHFAISNTANYWEAGPNPANESYTDQVITLRVVETVNCNFKVVIPANYKLNLYYKETDASPTTDRWINGQASAYTLSCDKKVVLSDGSVKYHFVSGDGYSVFLKYDASRMTATENHSWNSATCTKPKTCNLCGATSGSALGHSYTNACDTSCNLCGTIRSTTHNYAAATCTKPKTCKTCGATSGSALGHSYTNACDTSCNQCGAIRSITHDYIPATCTKPKTCKTCGATSGVALGHDYTNACDTSCNLCGALRSTTHNYAAATCTEPQTCIVCGYMVGDALGHTWEDGACTTCGMQALPEEVTVSLSKTSYTYDGKAKKPSVSVTDRKGDELREGIDYTVIYDEGCLNVGTYSVTVKMKGYYTGTVTKTFEINPISIDDCTISLSKTSYTYNGKAQKPSVIVLNHKGTKLGTVHYTVSYASGRKNVGTYKVTVKMRGNYTGSVTKTFKVNPAKTSVKSLTAGKKSLKVAITKKTTQISGYQIQYSTSKSFKSYKGKTLTSYKKTSLTLTGLSAKKTYYVRVRTYKTVNGKKYYSGWSTIKYKKTK